MTCAFLPSTRRTVRYLFASCPSNLPHSFSIGPFKAPSTNAPTQRWNAARFGMTESEHRLSDGALKLHSLSMWLGWKGWAWRARLPPSSQRVAWLIPNCAHRASTAISLTPSILYAGWGDDSYCGRPTSTFRSCALREHGNHSNQPASPVLIVRALRARRTVWLPPYPFTP